MYVLLTDILNAAEIDILLQSNYMHPFNDDTVRNLSNNKMQKYNLVILVAFSIRLVAYNNFEMTHIIINIIMYHIIKSYFKNDVNFKILVNFWAYMQMMPGLHVRGRIKFKLSQTRDIIWCQS